MPRQSVAGAVYPADWPGTARQLKERAGWKCERCGRPQTREPGKFLTIHHLDMDPSHSDPERYWWNLPVLCCPCHLQIQHRVILERPWVLCEHTEWFKPFAAGYYAYRYRGQFLPRQEVMERLDELLDLERQAVLGVSE